MSTILHNCSCLPSTDPYGTGATASVFPGDAVDWILLEFRRHPTVEPTACIAAFVRNDGLVVDSAGRLPVLPEHILPHGRYHIVVRHRNHLAVMSAEAVVLHVHSMLCDLTTGREQIYHSGSASAMVQLDDGVWAVPPGDIDQNGVIDRQDWQIIRDSSGNTGYRTADVNFDGIVNAVDRISALRFIATESDVPPVYTSCRRETTWSVLQTDCPLECQLSGTWAGTYPGSRGVPVTVTLTVEQIDSRTVTTTWVVDDTDTAPVYSLFPYTMPACTTATMTGSGTFFFWTCLTTPAPIFAIHCSDDILRFVQHHPPDTEPSAVCPLVLHRVR